jgi:hypothetical protein
MFNNGNYYRRFLNGEFLACLRKESTPNSIDEPSGSRSLTIDYLDVSGTRVCRVHMYLRADGTLGGRSHLPDPKQLVEDGIKYIIKSG